MKKKFRKMISSALLFAILFTALSGSAFAETTEPSKVVNLVYDDSSSMIIDDFSHKQVDRWCQAKYAMEVFAAMLGRRDELNIYCMSDFCFGVSAGPHLELSGRDKTADNIGKVHEMLTEARETPFASVKKAYSDLLSQSADEKWLVILTDGQFQNAPSSLSMYFAEKDPSVNVMFLALDEGADSITQNESEGIFFKKASSSEEILGVLTDASARIFSRHKLTLDKNNKFSFDLPMSELVVFAQGQNISVNGLKDSAGTALPGKVEQVSVKYSEIPTTSKSYVSSSNKIATNLQGQIVTYRGDYDVGSYTLDVSGADTVEIYYKPNVSIGIILTDKDGLEVTTLEKLEAGTYTVNYGLVKNGTDIPVPESKLLGNVKYTGSFSNNGKDLGQVRSGDKISLEEGNIEIRASANYMEYNTVFTAQEYRVWRNKLIGYSFPSSNPTYTIENDSVDTSVPYVVNITLDGKELTPAQWTLFTTPTVTISGKHALFSSQVQDSIFKDATVEKGPEPGVFYLYPNVRDGGAKRDGTEYGDVKFVIEYSEKVDDELWSGKSEGVIKVSDKRPWWVMNWRKLVFGAICLAILILLLGYVIKPRFPRGMKGKHTITATTIKVGRVSSSQTIKGRFHKDFLSVALPYVAETGTMEVVPKGQGKKLNLRAKNRNTIVLRNAKAFAGDENVRFGASPIPAATKGSCELSPSVTVKYTVGTMQYTCNFFK